MGISVHTGDGYEKAIYRTGAKAGGGQGGLTWSSDLSLPELVDGSF